MSSECCICFEVIRSTENRPVATRCGHIFHESCINSCFEKQNLCPQCNQPAHRYQLIRLFINQSENCDATKDELIEKLKLQLNELTEKAQLQYDLIASLNKQISLIESKNVQIKKESTSTQPTTSTVFNKIHRKTLQKNSSKFSDSSTPFKSIPASTKNDLYKAIGYVIFGQNSPEVTFKPTAVTPSKDSTIVPSSLTNLFAIPNTQLLPLASNDTLGSASNSAESSTTTPSFQPSTTTSTAFQNIFGNNALQLPQASKNAESAKPFSFISLDNSASQLPQALKSAKPFSFISPDNCKEIAVSSGGRQHAFKFSNISNPITSQATMTNFSTGFSASRPSTINGDASSSISAFKFEGAKSIQTFSPDTGSLPVSASANRFSSSSTVNSNITTKVKNSSVSKTSTLTSNGSKWLPTPAFTFEPPSTQSASEKLTFTSSFSRNHDQTTAKSTSFPSTACDTNTNVASISRGLVARRMNTSAIDSWSEWFSGAYTRMLEKFPETTVYSIPKGNATNTNTTQNP